MANLSIRERIEAQLLITVAAISGIGTARRWDMRGLTNQGPLDVFIVLGDDEVDEGAEGSIGVTIKRAELYVGVAIQQSEDDTSEVTSVLRNRWIGRVQAAVMADTYVIETGTSAKLAVDIRETGTGFADYMDGTADAIAAFEVEYQHYSNDPCTGPGITAVAE
uniref:Tail protein n=1 Tax=viral metagenome TaxID=1070528 RepID=A0A6M3IKK7_9ZZZZ